MGRLMSRDTGRLMSRGFRHTHPPGGAWLDRSESLYRIF